MKTNEIFLAGRWWAMPLGTTMEAHKVDDSWKVTVTAPVFVNKVVTLPQSWSTEFTAIEVIKDISETVARRYGMNIVTELQ